MASATSVVKSSEDRSHQIEKIREDSLLATALNRPSSLWAVVRKPLNMLFFPRALHSINSALSNDFLAQLTTPQVKDLYGPLAAREREANAILDQQARRSSVRRALASPWTARVSRETGRLSDVVESLAWSANDELRGHIQSSVEALKQQLR